MSDLVGNPEDRFSRVAAQLLPCYSLELVDISGSNLLQMSFRYPEYSSNIIGCVNRSVPLAKGLGIQLPKTVHANRMFSTQGYFTTDRFEIFNCMIHLDQSCTEELVFTHNHLPKFEFLFVVQCLLFIVLSWNSIQIINVGAIKFSANLEKIDLSHNKFGKVPSNESNLNTVFHYNEKLKVVDLTRNYLSTIPKETFVFNPNLRNIGLSDNRLSQIHFKISHLLHLEILDMRHNSIKFLDQNSRYEIDELYRRQTEEGRWVNDSKTFQILLDGNPFLCDCFLYEFLVWFEAAPFLEDTKNSSYCVVNHKLIPMNRSAVDKAEEDCNRHILTPMYFQYLYIKYSNYVKQNMYGLISATGILILTSSCMFVRMYYIKTLNRRFFKTKPLRKGGKSRSVSPTNSALQHEDRRPLVIDGQIVLDAAVNNEELARPGSFLQLEDRRSLVTDYQLILDASASVGKLFGFGITGTCFRVGEKYIMTARHVIGFIIEEGNVH